MAKTKIEAAADLAHEIVAWDKKHPPHPDDKGKTGDDMPECIVDGQTFQRWVDLAREVTKKP